MSVTYARGFTAGAVACGVKYPDRLDVAVVLSERPCTAAAVYTKNEVVAAPIVVTRRHLAAAKPRAIVVNSGNANACTGVQGERDAGAVCAAVAQRLGLKTNEVAVASTGVIGVRLPLDRIVKGLSALALSPEGGADAARAIMTTDTRPKTATREVTLAGGSVRVGGMAKGAGMIHPDLATLLCFVTTDAAIDAASLQLAVTDAAEHSFNSISVDGDTSTNDTLLVLANGASGVEIGESDGPAFTDALREVCLELARAIVADGEGATKVFEVRVSGARDAREARLAARTIASSNLVKTAVHGADPNWGRVLAAAGRSGARVDDRRASVRIDGQAVYDRGTPCRYDAAALRRALEGNEIVIELDLALGDASAHAWGCDLTAEYVRINSDYTT